MVSIDKIWIVKGITAIIKPNNSAIKLKYGLNFSVSVPRDIAREFKDEVIKFDISVDKDLKIVDILVDFFGKTYIGKGFDGLSILNGLEEDIERVKIKSKKNSVWKV